ncbi:MAG TPA: hypothetical protein VEP90_22180 [Methylomirabilota bacterium]|nr:hypothetical protein [Methylomirabilota bacterium]
MAKWDEWRTSKAGVILFYSYFVALIVAGVAIGIGLIYIISLVQQNHRALCSLKNGYVRQLHQTQKFQRTHPHGAPVLGFSAADVQNQIRIFKSQVNSLSDINCK